MEAVLNVYMSIGVVLYLLVAVRVLYCIGKYAFVQAFHEYPSLDDVEILPGWRLFGDNNTAWAIIALLNILAYVLLGWTLIIPFWGFGIFVLINVIISASRWKRFGRR